MGAVRRREHHGPRIGQILTHVDFLDAQIGQLDDWLEALLAPSDDLPELVATIPGVSLRGAHVLPIPARS